MKAKEFASAFEIAKRPASLNEIDIDPALETDKDNESNYSFDGWKEQKKHSSDMKKILKSMEKYLTRNSAQTKKGQRNDKRSIKYLSHKSLNSEKERESVKNRQTFKRKNEKPYPSR